MGKAKQSNRRSFTPAYKENAVGLAKELGNASAASRQLGISQSLLRSWIIASQLNQRSGLGLAAALEDKERMAKLERQVKALEEENTILKKSNGPLRSGPPEPRYAFIQKHRQEWSVMRMCKVLQVSKSGFYAWVNIPEALYEPELPAEIVAFQKQTHQVYGHRRLLPEMKSKGHKCSKNKILRILREENIRGKIRKIRPYSKVPKSDAQVIPNSLGRKFEVDSPNQ